MKLRKTPVQGQGFVRPETSMSDILVRHKAESRIDSRLFAERIGIKHKKPLFAHSEAQNRIA